MNQADSYIDVHIHIADIDGWHPVKDSPVCTCAHTRQEFDQVELYARRFPGCVVPVFGIHPQNPDVSYLPVLEQLLKEHRIAGIGEAGFDFFSPEYTVRREQQETVWQVQLELAVRYEVPMIIHCRKGLDKMFSYARQLSRVPSVIFHSFAGSPAEAGGFLKRRINAFFSFGKPLLMGSRRAAACVQNLPPERLLFETDAPYQRLKGETITVPEDIVAVYKTAAVLRNETLEQTTAAARRCFYSIFCNN